MNLNDLRVLIVDDHSLTRNLVRAIMRHFGFSSITADGGKAALRKLESEDVHIVICDWMMPDLQGIEVLRAVRRDPRFEEMPFILLTAESTLDRVHLAIEEGADDYIIKPFNAATIGEKLRIVLAKQYPEVAKSIAGD